MNNVIQQAIATARIDELRRAAAAPAGLPDRRRPHRPVRPARGSWAHRGVTGRIALTR
jgi:hypothetical protein